MDKKIRGNLSGKSERWLFLCSCIGSLIFISLVFFVLSGICFGLVEIITKTNHIRSGFHCDWSEYLFKPGHIFTVYGDWWKLFIKSLRHIDADKVLFIPFVAVIGTVITSFVIFIRQEYAVRLWYLLNFRFADLPDIKKMELHKNIFMVLGKFAGILLGAKQNESVLCLGEMGSGKTSGISIPSVLRSDNASVLAIDLTGRLSEYTAGYRSKLGEVVYFNWDNLDDPQKNIFYPRWNPFVKPHLPDNPEDINLYLQRLASYFVEINDKEQNNYWNIMAHDLISTIFNYWVSKSLQAKANDYFLEKLAAENPLTKDDKDILLSYYIQMPKAIVGATIEKLNYDELDADSYFPIGSWGGAMKPWMGYDICFASITDWLIYNYSNSRDNGGFDWSRWIRSLLDESTLFAYGQHIVDGFKRILELSAQQRDIIFERAVKPFLIFTEPSIRERTNGNDVDFYNLRGKYDEETQKWQPMTIYSFANTAVSKVINSIFVDEILYYALQDRTGGGALPLLVVLDDVGHNMRLRNLINVLEKGEAKKISSLLLCNSLSLVANTYSREELESIIMNTDYKVIKASDNRRLSQQMDKLASFATRSVEIPRTKHKKFGRVKPYADANYFHRLAQDFKLCHNVEIKARDKEIVLMRGFYNRPIMADSVFFENDERFKKLSLYPANYTLQIQKVLQKNEKELFTPATDFLKDE